MMVQRQCITAWRCLETQSYNISRLRSSLLARSAQCRRLHGSMSKAPASVSRPDANHLRFSNYKDLRTSISPSQSRSPTIRSFTSTPHHHHGDLTPPKPGEERHITFIDKEGRSNTFEVADGDNLLDIAQANDLEMEGACGGSCACSTCHVIVDGDDMYDKMEEPSDDENDMLDLAFGLTETSRLGCQVKMSQGLDGLVVSEIKKGG